MIEFKFAQGVCRCIIEVIFLFLQIHLYGFTVENNFPCEGGGANSRQGIQNPCPPQERFEFNQSIKRVSYITAPRRPDRDR